MRTTKKKNNNDSLQLEHVPRSHGLFDVNTTRIQQKNKNHPLLIYSFRARNRVKIRKALTRLLFQKL